MSEAILPAQAIQQEDRQTNDWSPAKVTYAVLMAVAMLSHLWLMFIDAGIDDIPTYIWIIRLLPIPFALCLGKLWKDRGFRILFVYFLWFFLRCFIPNPGSIFSVDVSESILSSLWLFIGCYGLVKVLTTRLLSRFFFVIFIVWLASMTVLSCLGICAVWTEQSIWILRGRIWFFIKQGIARLNLIYMATISGAMMSITILIGVILSLSVNHRLYKIFSFIMLIPITIAMALTDSRTAFISVSAGLAIMTFSSVFHHYQIRKIKDETQEKPKQWRPWILGTVAMAIVFLLLIIIILQIAPAFNYIRTKGLFPNALAEEATRTDVTTRGFTGNSVLSGRAELWTEIIQHIYQNKSILLKGIAKQAPLAQIDVFFGHCHCLYLQILLESGIPGLLLVLAFIVYTAINAFRAITNPELPLWLRMLPSVFVSMVVADLAECFLWLRSTQAPMSAVFFISAGILNTLTPHKHKEHISE